MLYSNRIIIIQMWCTNFAVNDLNKQFTKLSRDLFKQIEEYLKLLKKINTKKFAKTQRNISILL